MARCRATTRAGTRCRNVAMEGSAFCGVHRGFQEEEDPGDPAPPAGEDAERLDREPGPSRPHGDPLAGEEGRADGSPRDEEEVEIEVEIVEGGCLGCFPAAAALLLLLASLA